MSKIGKQVSSSWRSGKDMTNFEQCAKLASQLASIIIINSMTADYFISIGTMIKLKLKVHVTIAAHKNSKVKFKKWKGYHLQVFGFIYNWG